MANYKKVNGHWEVIPSSREQDTVMPEVEAQAMSNIQDKLNVDTLKQFVKTDAPTDFLLKIFIPRYYNDGTKVSSDVLAEIMQKISEAIGGISSWAGKGYWTNDNILYEDKNIYGEILLRGVTPERATLFSKYIGSIIAEILKQEGALTIIVPALSDFIDKKDYEENAKEALKQVDSLNSEEEKYQNQEKREL